MEAVDETPAVGPSPAPRHPNAGRRRLQGKVAAITGAGGSIGLQTVVRLLREGARVAFIDINRESFIEASEALKPFENADILFIEADVAEETDVQHYIQQTVQYFGRLDFVFLNAGISYSSTSIMETTEELYEKVMRINVKSAFLGLKHAAGAIRDCGNGGSILLTSSIAGLRGTPGLSLYSASKFALRGLALTASQELGQYGIRVNTIHPSGINTPMFLQAWSPAQREEMRKGVPLGRFAEVEDITGTVAFLASDDSKFVTGAFLKVDGGIVSF
ncbi:hypothetical protein PV08_02870 [Exophiala spinifera]|uniref:Glucose 1-dehydrogenase n=1 Tax=Exophiala spinifera TaxID=91928 RepID=A0A0D2A0U0_9EURO|nr:uncharacterized protein PV08_02870 [Exophiala spinifera]KIW18582.1 hypothetical protein PV08_02870 [Exophiala spinifera]